MKMMMRMMMTMMMRKARAKKMKMTICWTVKDLRGISDTVRLKALMRTMVTKRMKTKMRMMGKIWMNLMKVTSRSYLVSQEMKMTKMPVIRKVVELSGLGRRS
jgi:hypothetical protein